MSTWDQTPYITVTVVSITSSYVRIVLQIAGNIAVCNMAMLKPSFFKSKFENCNKTFIFTQIYKFLYGPQIAKANLGRHKVNYSL
jgi:hypothetical protein